MRTRKDSIPNHWRTLIQCPALLFDETLAMAVYGAGVAQCPGLGQVCCRRHQMPGFTKRFEATASTPAAGRIEAHEAVGSELVDRNYIPNTKRHDIGCEEVNLVGPVRFDLVIWAVVAGADGIGGMGGLGAGGWFYLYPPESLARVEDEIVALLVSIRLGYAKAQARR